MIIRYFAMLRDITHQKEQTLNTGVKTVRELMHELCAFYGPEFRRWVVDENGELGGLSILLVNGTDCRDQGGLDMPIRANDVIAIFPPVAGG